MIGSFVFEKIFVFFQTVRKARLLANVQRHSVEVMNSMTGEIDYDELFDEFPDLLEDTAIFQKEVLAHFGLLFSAFANLETSLQMCFVFTSLASELSNRSFPSQQDWETRHDALESQAHFCDIGEPPKYDTHHFFEKRTITCTPRREHFISCRECKYFAIELI